ncbi:MAG TPA: hypothetical protein VIR15_07485 [Intrasporangium sp.]|uniref:hypothetical protein n=1 Tax=Intrasporangium sp. TaxID=1925024 RepID=UPI002F933196
MSDKKIQVELDEDVAREYVDRTKAHGGPIADVREKIRAALPPEYPEGTVAWVTYDDDVRYLGCRVDGGWTHSSEGADDLLDRWVKKVEPLRVLADDEVAVKVTRDPFDRGFSSTDVRIAADLVESQLGLSLTANGIRAFADALDAEATS